MILASIAFLGGLPSQAATFTPYVNTELGYTDNLRNTQNPRRDGYLKFSPGASLNLGKPTNNLYVSGQVDYAYYFSYPEETGFDGGFLNALYKLQPSPRWLLQLQNLFSSTYDQAQIDAQGNFVRLRSEGGRFDTNTTSVRGEHSFSPHDKAYAAYSYAISRYSEDDKSDFDQHRLTAGGIYRLSPAWQTQLDLTGTRTNYNQSPNEESRGAQGSIARLIGPHKKAFLQLAYSDLRVKRADPEVRKAREYELYSASLGYEHTVSPALSWGASAGASRVEGDKRNNQAAGKLKPIFSAWIKFTGKLWSLDFYSSSSLGEYTDEGDRGGLAYTYKVGGNYNYKFAQFWTFYLGANYVHDEYEQDSTLAGLDPRGDVDTYSLGTGLSWRTAQYTTLSLNYRYTKTDEDGDINDRSENRVYINLSYAHPYRW